ncbi:MAG: hypothetical protein R3F58_03190 [Steroidobacteraceae bacterium]|nr:hypothetical protein [Steroidobacteraceae bacterium]
MSRPHICFIQSQCLAWQSATGWGFPQAEVKTLSLDEDTGEATALLRWATGARGVLEVPAGRSLEVLVLQGELAIDGVALSLQGYLFRVAEAARGLAFECGQGTTLLVMRNRLRNGDCDVAVADTFAEPWRFGAEGSVTGKPLGNGLATKSLRYNEATGERSFLYAALAQHPPPAVMVGKFAHPMIEELFLLDGSYVFGDVGRMRRGAYVWWREHEFHGPTGSVSGYHLFIRVLGGPLRNEFSREPAPFSYGPPYRPALPPALRTVARETTGDLSW